jgi:ATP-dependent Clp protease ATP-binding subunit ClpC
MAPRMCQACKKRPAATEVTVSDNGSRRKLFLCEQDYEALARRNRRQWPSPFESLFRGFFDEFPGEELEDEPTVPRGRRSRESVDLDQYLSEQAKEVLQDAARTAVDFGKTEVDTEHLLRALSDQESVKTILDSFKISIPDLKAQIEADAAPSSGKRVEKETASIGVSPRVKSALQKALEASQELGHSYVGPEHLLIGLAEEEDGHAGELLRKVGVTAQALRQKALKVVGKSGKEGGGKSPSATSNLDKFSRDLTELARQGKLDPVIGRAKEIESTIEVLARRKKNNPVLIGDPGVGKTAIVEGLAQRIVKNDVPEVLRGKRLVELNINSMVAGSKYRGEFEERVKHVLDEIVANQESLVVFIDELHTIVGAGQGGGEGGLDIANVFKPALARGELHLIGATTLSEYQKYIEKDAALERRFQPVMVDEPSVDDTTEILRGLRDRLEAHHKVKIGEEAILAAARLSDRYITGRKLPDKAIDLIDQAAARVRIAASSRPAELQKIESSIEQQKREQDSASAAKEFEKAKKLEARIKAEAKKLAEATERWKKSVGTTSEEVTARHVAEIVSRLTGIPVTELTAEERQKLLGLEERLGTRVVGQPEALRAVSEAVRLARAGLKEPGHPIATFLFLGPTGVGKTELAKSLAWCLFEDEDAVTRIDMSEYGERHTVARLIGAPPGYVGYEEGGQLTERVRRRPYSVVLLDEIEKAHPEVHNVLLQLFDEGRLTDGKGRVVDFTNTVIIATSNIGSDLIQRNLDAPEAEKLAYAALKGRLQDLLRRRFRPEFLNRIDEVIVFQALGKKEIESIVLLQLERVRKTALGRGVKLEFDPALVAHVAEVGYQPEYGARELKRRIRSELETRLASDLLKGTFAEGDVVRAGYDAATGAVTLAKPPAKAKEGAA